MVELARDVLDRAAQGDIRAFEEVYRAYSGFVYNVALRFSRSSPDAQEVTQDVFMKIYRALKNFEFRSEFKTWVYRIAVNTAINHYRKSGKIEKGKVPFDASTEAVAGVNSTASAVIQDDSEKRVNVLLDVLSPKYKACLVLREIQGLSYEEIAASLKIPVNTVRSRLKRARASLLEAAGRGRVIDAV